MKKALPVLAALLVCGSFAPVARAQEGFYVGAGAHRSSFDASSPGANFSINNNSYKAALGLRNKYGAFEIGYSDLGKVDEQNGAQSVHAEGNIWTASFLYIFPFSKWFELSLQAGYGRWSSKTEGSDGITMVASDDHGDNFIYGLGIGFNFGAHAALRVDYNRYGDFGNAQNVDDVGAMIIVTF